MTLLSICMPSNRDLKRSRAAIDSALAYAERVGARLIVSDNSGDPEKRVFWEGKSPNLDYLAVADNDPMSNLMSAISRVATPFVLPMGDDDEICLFEGEEPVDLAKLPADVAGVRPQTQLWTMRDGVKRTERFTIDAGTPSERILEYGQKAQGNNSVYYSIYRSDLFLPLISLFNASHPTKGGYCDWALCFSLFACGKMVHDPSLIYRYDLGRWAERESLEEAKLSLLTAAGLPAHAEHFSALLTFLDIFVFLMRGSSPLTQAERHESLTMNCRIALAPFIRAVEAAPVNYDETTRYLTEMLTQETDVNALFAIALTLTDCIQPGLKDRYVRFYQDALAA